MAFLVYFSHAFPFYLWEMEREKIAVPIERAQIIELTLIGGLNVNSFNLPFKRFALSAFKKTYELFCTIVLFCLFFECSIFLFEMCCRCTYENTCFWVINGMVRTCMCLQPKTQTAGSILLLFFLRCVCQNRNHYSKWIVCIMSAHIIFIMFILEVNK